MRCADKHGVRGSLTIARQGNVKEWHFAHAAQPYDQVCDYTFFVSVRDMVKQMMLPGIELSLPSLSLVEGEVRHDVTKARTAIPGGIARDYSAKGIRFDLCYDIAGVPLAIFLSHPGRKLIFDDEAFGDDLIGILEIEIDKVLLPNAVGSEYTERIRNSLCREVICKKWRYHPRLRKLQSRIRDKEEKRRLDQERSSSQIRNFECLQCRRTWQGTIKEQYCTKCETHLFSRETSA